MHHIVSDDGATIDFLGCDGDNLVAWILFKQIHLVTDDDLIRLLTPAVERINARVYSLTDASIMAVAETCPKLAVLNVSANSRLTDVSIKAVAENCANLTMLDVSQCRKITDASIMAIAENCRRLTSLDFEGCDKVTNVAIKAVVTSCPSILEDFSVEPDMQYWR